MHKAYSLIELFTAILIVTCISVIFVMNDNATKQTPEREAEKIAAKIKNLMQQADRRHMGFRIEFYEGINEMRVRWSDDKYQVLKVSPGFKITANDYGANLVYSVRRNSFLPPGRTITVKRDDGKEHYIIIYTPGGRVRTSSIAP